MNRDTLRPAHATPALGLLLALALPAAAFDSGSTGADGAFNPAVNTELQLPPDGIFNFTTVNIPSGVTVTFRKNTTNTPVVILASGDVTIDGLISLNGSTAPAAGAAGDGNIGDDGLPGLGGPGGYDGGRGGQSGTNRALNVSGAGLGPGGAGRSGVHTAANSPCGGAGAGFGASGVHAGSTGGCANTGQSIRGEPYGTSALLPLVGGSGGAGGAGFDTFDGAGGGGGGGALLIASSGVVTINGTIRTNGGQGGASSGQGSGGAGGGGSGGAIRIIASAIAGEGGVTATGGPTRSGTNNDSYGRGGAGGVGRIRFEAETITRTAATTPNYSFGAPGPVFVAGLPTLRIASVGGVEAPAAPTGSADLQFPEDAPNPMPVVVQTSGVPVGNTVTISVSPAYGARSEFITNALSGSEEDASATAEVTLPAGPSVLLATVSYTVTDDQGNALAVFTGGDPVQSVELTAGADGRLVTVLTTVTGRRVELGGPVAAAGAL
jgi:hypothetical protein